MVTIEKLIEMLRTPNPVMIEAAERLEQLQRMYDSLWDKYGEEMQRSRVLADKLSMETIQVRKLQAELEAMKALIASYEQRGTTE